MVLLFFPGGRRSARHFSPVVVFLTAFFLFQCFSASWRHERAFSRTRVNTNPPTSATRRFLCYKFALEQEPRATATCKVWGMRGIRCCCNALQYSALRISLDSTEYIKSRNMYRVECSLAEWFMDSWKRVVLLLKSTGQNPSTLHLQHLDSFKNRKRSRRVDFQNIRISFAES